MKLLLNFISKLSLGIMLLLAIQTSVFSQKNKFLGISLGGEYTPKTDWRFEPGLTFEHQLTKHIGYETGLFYRSEKNRISLTLNNDVYFKDIRVNYLAVPLLFKYYSRFLNYSIGPNFDYYIGWSERNTSDNIHNWEITSISVDPKFIVGLLMKISKPIPISEKIIIEPEIKYSFFPSIESGYFGIGVIARYKL